MCTQSDHNMIEGLQALGVVSLNSFPILVLNSLLMMLQNL